MSAGRHGLTPLVRSSILERVPIVHRLTAAVLCLGLIAANAAVCAGWAATPETRMACCTAGECPMHKGESQNSGSGRLVTQAQADTCCALSERQQSGQSALSFITVISSAVLGTGVVVPTPVPALTIANAWRTVVPTPLPPVSRHVLISVFLV